MTANASLVAELALTARNFGPAEAEKLGLVSRVVPGGQKGVTDEAVKLAKVIASASHSLWRCVSTRRRPDSPASLP